MARLRVSVQVDPDSRMALVPESSSKNVPQSSGNLELDEASTSSEAYARVASRGKILVAQRVHDVTVLTEQPALAQIRLKLEECRTILAYFESGPSRTGALGKLKNLVTGVTRRALNWFVAPSIMFDKSAAEALNETAASIELLHRQVHVLAQQLATLTEANGREDSGHQVSSKQNP
jgi:hypothetical protein